MAKYDGYALTSKLVGGKGEVVLVISALFEENDNVVSVMSDVRAKAQVEITALKASGYLDNFK